MAAHGPPFLVRPVPWQGQPSGTSFVNSITISAQPPLTLVSGADAHCGPKEQAMTIMCAPTGIGPERLAVCPACGARIVGFDVRRGAEPVAELASSGVGCRRSRCTDRTARRSSAVRWLLLPPSGDQARTATTDAARADRGRSGSHRTTS